MKSLSSILFSLITILFITGCASVNDTTHTFNTVVIDPGHGGRDNGTHSRSGLKEKNLTLKTGFLLNQKLIAAGFHTVMTRKGDYFVSLDERCAISNRQHNAVYISIHFNDAGRKRWIHGPITFYRSITARPMAQIIERHVAAIHGDRQLVKYANFHVLRDNRFPAVLIECGFLSNRREAAQCDTAYHQNEIADAITDAFIEMRKR